MPRLPILFLHGNGDSAAVWMTTLWRFESNGYPRTLLHTLDLPYPTARDQDDAQQEGRSSIAQYTQALAEQVQRILHESGASKLILVGNSRGGYPIRSYIKFGIGNRTVAKAVLGGTPNHGVWADEKINPGNEFNGEGAILHELNAVDANGDETTAGVRFLTLRSDHFDKYAQPSGEWIGQSQMATHVGFDGPALHGALNLVLPGRDHRELSFHADAFKAAYRFICGHAPKGGIEPETQVVLDGCISALLRTAQGDEATNLPLPGALLDIFEVDAASGQRIALRHQTCVGENGRWGPFSANPAAFYEFVIAAPGYATSHIYRSPFPRSSGIVHLRLARAVPEVRGSIVTMVRPRGYFGMERDAMSLDGRTPPGLPNGFPGLAESRLVLPEGAPRSVIAECNGERIAVQSWPAHENHLVFAELHY